MKQVSNKKKAIRLINWILFGVSASIFLAAVYNAAMGQVLNLGVLQIGRLEPGALLVASIVTVTWVTDGLALRWHVPESASEWVITALLCIVAFVVDIYVLAGVMAGYRVPTTLPLIVVMAHAGTHVLEWIVTSASKELDSGVLSPNHVPVEDYVRDLEGQVKSLEATNKALERENTSLTKEYTEVCDGCGKVFTASTAAKAKSALGGHTPRCPATKAKSNGHRHPIAVAD